MTTIETESITLYYRNGSSDKIYQAAVEPSGPGFIVTFAYGRRGSTLTTGRKTELPIGFDEAKKIYAKLVKEKMGKVYTPGEDGTPYQNTEKADRATGVLPQLLNAIDECHAQKYIADAHSNVAGRFPASILLLRFVRNFTAPAAWRRESSCSVFGLTHTPLP